MAVAFLGAKQDSSSEKYKSVIDMKLINSYILRKNGSQLEINSLINYRRLINMIHTDLSSNPPNGVHSITL